ncbi:hypothetical protein [Peijinzhouia sedimentorum]
MFKKSKNFFYAIPVLFGLCFGFMVPNLQSQDKNLDEALGFTCYTAWSTDENEFFTYCITCQRQTGKYHEHTAGDCGGGPVEVE